MSKPVSLSLRALHRLFLRPNKRQRLRHLARLRLIEQLEMRALLTGVTLIDLNQTPAGSDPSAVVVVGDQGFFSAGDGTHGRELWRTDGTEAGTVLVKDIQPGPSGSLSQSGFSQSVDVSGTLFFVADELTHGQELWKSDGTEAGTVLVKDIYPGRESSSIQALTASNGRLYFLANDGVHGNELWTSDGTEAGTVLVKDIHPSGSQKFDSDGGSIVSFGDGVLFGASDGVRGRELWRSDGTEEGTSMVIGLLPIETDPSRVEDGFRGDLVAFGSQAFFTGYTKATGGKMYRTDGTEAGTQRFGGETLLRPRAIVDLAGALYFFGYDGLYQSDGSSTDPVSRISDLPEFIENITLVGNRVFFSAHDDQFGEQLWTSDGTEAGTLRVTEIDRGLDFRGEPMGAAILSIHDFGGVAFVVLNDGIHGGELWRSDGTQAGTRIVKDINPGQLSNDLYDEGAVLGGQFIFPADNGTGGELWKTDGTEAGTTMIKEIDTVSTQPSNPGGGIKLGNSLIITADDGIHGRELILTDGTRMGTSLLKDIYPDGDSSPGGMGLIADTLFFSAEDPTHGRELWKTDGTQAGTVLVRDINPGSASSTPTGSFVFDNKLYFGARDDIHGRELWVSDGSEAGTKMIKDIRPGTGDGLTSIEFAVFKGELYFQGNDGNNGRELWKTDGTTAGTVLVKNFGSGSSDPSGFTVFGDSLYLTADGPQGDELYKSDGTSAGTVLVKDINPGSRGSFLGTFAPVIVGGQMFFMANDGIHGYELWKSDGTEAGTTLVKDIEPGEGNSFPGVGIEIGGVLIFLAGQTGTGLELWKTDGTPEGTKILKDIYPGNQSSLRSLYGFNSNSVFEGELYFDAHDGVHGRELWKTDGTEAGTVLVVDIVPGPEGSTPTGFAQIGGKLLFSAGSYSKYSFDNKVELFRLGVDPAMVTASMTDTLSIDVNNDGKANPGDTLKYTTTLSVGSEADADGVLYTQTIDANTTIVPGSVSTSQGTVFTGSNGGNSLNIGLGTIPAGSVVSIAYSVRVRDPLSANVTQISNQGTFSGDNFSNLLTDDPSQAGASDPTTTPIDTGTAAGIAPVATDFPLPAIPLGSVLHIDATDMIAEFGTDADSLLNAMSVSFGSATINGTPVASLAELGFSYTPGAGPAGAFTIDANASAYAGLAAGFAHDVIINFTVSDGALQDSGVLTFKVANAAAKFKDVAFHFLGATSPESQVKAIADAAAGESIFFVVASGTNDVSDALDHANFFVGGFDTSKVAGTMLTVAQAAATNASLASAAAANESIAVAIADDQSDSTAVADNHSVASAESQSGSGATSAADDNSAASSRAVNNSDALALAEEGSAAEASAENESSATATAKAISNATSTSSQNSVSVSSAETTSSATAFASHDSVSTADALVGSISNAVGKNFSATASSAANGSDVLAFADVSSTATSNADQQSSASSSAEESSNASSFALNQATATANASEGTSSNAKGRSDSSMVATTIVAEFSNQPNRGNAEAEATQPVLRISTPIAPIMGPKNTALPLSVDVAELDGETVASILISNLPAGSVLSAGTSNADGSEWTFTDKPPVSLTLKPPAGFVGNIEVSITAMNARGTSAHATLAVKVEGVADGVLIRKTVNLTEDKQIVSREANLNIPGMPAGVLHGVDLNDPAAVRAALVAAGANSESIRIVVARRDDGQAITTLSKNTVTESPDALWTGDIDDPDNIAVITGTVTVTTTITTTTTKMFTDVLTITGELVMQQPTADLSLVVTVDNGSAEVGQNVTFTIVLNNAGPDAATGVTVLDKLPVGLQFVQANTASGSYSSESGVWTVGGLPVGGTSSLTIVAKLLTDQTINNLAEIASSDQFDPDSTPNNGVVGEDDQFSASVGTCLTGGPLVAGMNRLVFSCVTPGGFAAFVVGTQPGSYTFSKWGTTVDMADPSVPAIGAAGINGVAVVLINLTPAQLAQPLYVQAFEMLPAHTVSNLMVAQNTPQHSGIPLSADTMGLGNSDDSLPALQAAAPALKAAAIARWQAAGVSQLLADHLATIDVLFSDLPNDQLAATQGNFIVLDTNAAGHGWFVDGTPHDNVEFTRDSNGALLANTSSARGHIDALTAIMHELGHVLGEADLPSGSANPMMSSTLSTGLRRLPTVVATPSINALDVNRDGLVTPMDALLIVNELNLAQGRLGRTTVNGNVLDVTGDDLLTPIDVLQVVNHLNRASSSRRSVIAPVGSGEGEYAVASAEIEQMESQWIDDTLLESLASDALNAWWNANRKYS
ncbi:MAG: DUF11 domain-containing protein [Pirellulaceae bacterium]|nr:DUF11 domain-containing protein [Pirellulaceae bacterium]